LLQGASGYAVYGSDGGRLGVVIELVTEGEDRSEFLAIRRDRIFVWRRRIVPLSAVAAVSPKERSVWLLLDGAGVERAHEQGAEEMREGWVADRIAPHAEAATAAAAATDGDAACESPASTEPRARGSLASDDGPPSPAAEPNGEKIGEQHLLFVPSAGGYALIERNTPPPRHAETLELDEPAGSFIVVKLAQSPLPDDRGRAPTLTGSFRQRAT
jgi:hypothetical protein